MVLYDNSYVNPVMLSGFDVVVSETTGSLIMVVVWVMLVMMLLLVRVAGEIRIIRPYVSTRRRVRTVEIAP